MSDQAFGLERRNLIGGIIVQLLWFASFLSSMVMTSFNDARQLQSNKFPAKTFFSVDCSDKMPFKLNTLSSEIYIILRIWCYEEAVQEDFCSLNKIKRQVRSENTNKRGHLSRTTCPDVLPKAIDVVLHGNKRILDIQSNQFRHSNLNSIFASHMTAIFGRDSRIMLFLPPFNPGWSKTKQALEAGAKRLP